jgi:hypothetical protein
MAGYSLYTLRLFGERAGIARRRYRQFVKEGAAPERRDRVGGSHEEQWSVGGDKNAWLVWEYRNWE